MGTILLIIVILLLVGALPAWPYISGWGYWPSGGVGLILDRYYSRFNGTSVNNTFPREDAFSIRRRARNDAPYDHHFAIDGMRHSYLR